jgi:hypothetical protein
MVRRATSQVDVPTVVWHAVSTALLTALVGVAVAVVLAMSAWALAPPVDGAGADDAARVAVAAWLYAHHVSLDVGAATYSLHPLGLLLLPLGISWVAGRQLDRTLQPPDLPSLARVVTLFAVVYGLVVAVTAGVATGSALSPHALEGWVSGTLVGLVGAGLGMLGVSGLGSELTEALPPLARRTAAGAAAGLAAAVGLSALLLALMLAVTFPESHEMSRALHADPLGSLLVGVLGISLLPNLLLWLLAFSTGIGFRLGDGSLLSPQGVEYGPLPVLPPLAAVPPEGDLPWWGLLVLVVPLCCGAVAGAVVYRRMPRDSSAADAAVSAALAATVAGLVVGMAAGLSGGSLGEDRMTELGPVGWQVGVAAAVEMALAAAVVAWEAHRRHWDGTLPWARGWPSLSSLGVRIRGDD